MPLRSQHESTLCSKQQPRDGEHQHETIHRRRGRCRGPGTFGKHRFTTAACIPSRTSVAPAGRPEGMGPNGLAAIAEPGARSRPRTARFYCPPCRAPTASLGWLGAGTRIRTSTECSRRSSTSGIVFPVCATPSTVTLISPRPSRVCKTATR